MIVLIRIEESLWVSQAFGHKVSSIRSNLAWREVPELWSRALLRRLELLSRIKISDKLGRTSGTAASCLPIIVTPSPEPIPVYMKVQTIMREGLVQLCRASSLSTPRFIHLSAQEINCLSALDRRK